MPKYRKKRQQAPYMRRSETQEETGEDNFLCSKYNKSVDQVLQCESCWNWYCGPCQNLSEEILQVAHFKCLHWFCSKCEPSVLKLVDKSKSAGVSDQCREASQEVIVTTVVEQIKSIIQETRECFKKTINEAFNKTSRNILADNMETDIPLTSNTLNGGSTSDVISALLSEEKERSKRRNVIVHNVEEFTADSDQERKEYYISTISSVFTKHLGVKTTIVNANCIQ